MLGYWFRTRVVRNFLHKYEVCYHSTLLKIQDVKKIFSIISETKCVFLKGCFNLYFLLQHLSKILNVVKHFGFWQLSLEWSYLTQTSSLECTVYHFTMILKKENFKLLREILKLYFSAHWTISISNASRWWCFQFFYILAYYQSGEIIRVTANDTLWSYQIISRAIRAELSQKLAVLIGC